MSVGVVGIASLCTFAAMKLINSAADEDDSAGVRPCHSGPPLRERRLRIVSITSFFFFSLQKHTVLWNCSKTTILN